MLEDRYRVVEDLIRKLIEVLGDDPSREGLRETPRRVAHMLLDELLSGYRQDPREVLKTFSVDEGDVYTEFKGVVVVTDIPLVSMCEHHMLPIIGHVHVAYIPSGRVVGLSKLARLVDVYAKRLQIQERLTNQIADLLYREIAPRGVMVVTEAIHLCVAIRGIRSRLRMTCIACRGRFEEDGSLRREVLSYIAKARGDLVL